MIPYRWGDPTPAKVVQLREKRNARRAALILARAEAMDEWRRSQNDPHSYVDDRYRPQGEMPVFGWVFGEYGHG